MRPASLVGIAALIAVGWYWLQNRRANADDRTVTPPGGGGGSVSVTIPGGPEGGAYVPPPAIPRAPAPPAPDLTPPPDNTRHTGAPLNVWELLGLPPQTGQHAPTQTPPPTAPPATGGGQQQQQQQQQQGDSAPPPNQQKFQQNQQQHRGSKLPPPSGGTNQDGQRKQPRYHGDPRTYVKRGLAPKTISQAGPLLPGQTYVAPKGAAHKGGGSKTGIGAYNAYQAGLRQTTVAATPALQKKRKPQPGKTADDVYQRYLGYKAGAAAQAAKNPGRRGQ